MKEGLILENNELVYYKNGRPYHAGLIRIDGAYYYISSGGRAVTGEYMIHSEMTNGLLKKGTYRFGEDGKLIKGSYRAPKKPSHFRRDPAAKHIHTGIMKFLDKIEYPWLLLTTLVLMCALCVLAVILDSTIHNAGAEQEDTSAVRSNIRVTMPDFEEPVSLCSTAAQMEYDGQISLKQAVETGDPYRSFRFPYTLWNASGILLLSEHQDFSDAREYPLTEEKQVLEIDNLKTGTTYYYKAVVNGEEYPGTFQTARSNRFVDIPALINTRDIGGYVNLDGREVRQGLLIRGVELDGLVNAGYFIPEDELDHVMQNFGFVYDMDLRSPEICEGAYTSRLGVPHKFYDSPMYSGIFQPAYIDAVHQIFTDLADPEKYPMYLHCTWGTDRTGTIVFLLQGVLNLSEEDMIREYRLTAYTNSGMAESDNMNTVVSGLESYDGNTLQEKIVSYLTKTAGITEGQIDSIREIFLEPA